MLGFVNQAIKDMVVSEFGSDSWMAICEDVQFLEKSFASQQDYPDLLTYQFVGSICKLQNMEASDVLIAFGEYWVLKTATPTYGILFKASGQTFAEFLEYLPNFHSKVMLFYPNINPPDFRVDKIAENQYRLFYFSHRQGLDSFVIGILQGLAKFYNEKIETFFGSVGEEKANCVINIQILK
jgi:hypothetical protein